MLQLKGKLMPTSFRRTMSPQPLAFLQNQGRTKEGRGRGDCLSLARRGVFLEGVEPSEKVLGNHKIKRTSVSCGETSTCKYRGKATGRIKESVQPPAAVLPTPRQPGSEYSVLLAALGAASKEHSVYTTWKANIFLPGAERDFQG